MLDRAVLFLSLLAFSGCAKKDAPHDHAAHAADASHAHTAPHGGTLVELGDHAYSLELVRDSATGKLTAYILDGHAENFIRISARSFAVNFTVGVETRGLLLQAVANPATGETVGDTSQFEAQADWLRSATGFDAVIPSVEIRGTKFANVAVRLQ